jgi:S-adenosylmethionine hydrolase
MPICTFLSDYGLRDHYVAAVKAALLREMPPAVIVDITHQIRTGDLAQAAYTLQAIFTDFPPGSVHIVAVDTTRAEQSRHLLVHHQDHWFIAPDNGLLPLALGEKVTKRIALHPGTDFSPSFPARHLYGRVAARLLQGDSPETLGTPFPTWVIKRFRQEQPRAEQLQGRVVHVDHYGNLITNIDQTSFESARNGKKFEVRFAHECITQLHHTYSELDFGDCLIFFNSQQQLEIAINQGNAAQLLGMKYNSPVTVHFPTDHEAE